MIVKEPANKRFVFTLFFMNHMLDKTGVSRFMLGQQKVFLSHGISYVSAFIIRRAYFNGRIEAFNEYGLLVDGEYQGVFSEPELTVELMKWNEEDVVMLDFHIHHFLHVKLDDIDHFLRSFPELSVKIYLHDYYTLCQNYNLLKNDEHYCGGKGLTPGNCNDCRYYNSSKVYSEKLFDLLNRFKDRLLFISPSETTKEIFLAFHPEYADKTEVIPHLKLVGSSRSNIEPVKEDEPVNIAFLGYRNPRKGWDLWKSITAQHKNDSEYSFFILNSDDLEYEDMKKVPVRFTEDSMDAMTKALIENRIHAVFLWSVWPETYSYTFFESYSANCFVITSKDSGNIAAVVQRYGNGRSFGSNSELDVFFSSRELKQEINRFRMSGKTGPEFIIDNDEMVDRCLGFRGRKQKVEAISGRKTNTFIMWVLNRHYDKRYRIKRIKT